MATKPKSREKSIASAQEGRDTVPMKDRETAASTSSFAGRDLLPYALGIVGAVILVYWPSFSFDLTWCDDNWFIFNHYGFHKEWGNLLNAFLQPMGLTYYRPVLTASFIVDAHLSGTQPWGYHLSNFVYHALGALLVFCTLIGLGYNRLMSFLLGLLFALHPILTPAISWISCRNDSMVAVFMFASFLCFVRFAETREYVQRIALYGLHLFFFGVALFTKETGVVLPLLCASYVVFFRKEPLFTKGNGMAAAGWLAVGLLFAFMRHQALSGVSSPDEIGLHPFLKNLPTPLFLLGKILLPVKMIAIPSFEAFTLVSGIIVLAAMVAATFLFRKKLDMGRIWFALSWFIAVLLPSFMIRIAGQEQLFDYSEHRAYLPMFAVLILIAEFCKSRGIDFRKPLALAIAVVILSVFAVRSHVYQWTFENRMAFWTHAVGMFPERPKAYQDLGEAYYAAGNLAKAEASYLKGISLNPRHKAFYINLSALYAQQGEIDRSEEAVRKALELEPNDPIAHYNLARLQIARNNPAAALPHLEKAAGFRSQKRSQILMELGQLRLRMNKPREAAAALEEALSLDPYNATILNDIGTAYFMTQQYESALQVWLKANRIAPNAPYPYFNLIRYHHFVSQNREEAAKYASEAKNRGLALPPDLQPLYK